MVADDVFTKMVSMFGDELANPEVYPKRAKHQYRLAKYELYLEQAHASAPPVSTDTTDTGDTQ